MGKEPAYKAGGTGVVGLILGSERSPGGGHGNPSITNTNTNTLVFLSGDSHGHRSLAGYSQQSCKKLDPTEVTEHTRRHPSVN